MKRGILAAAVRLGAMMTWAVLLTTFLGGSSFGTANAQLVDGSSRRAARGIIQDRHIVVLRKGVRDSRSASRDIVRFYGLTSRHTYSRALKGFSATISPGQLEFVKNDPDVAYVEPDRLVYAVAQILPTGVDRIEGEKNATANIDGVDERVDADIAIIDSGVGPNHPDINLYRAVNFHCARFRRSGSCRRLSTPDDENGHGTHVAGTAAALDNASGVVGVAPGARIWSVKVLGRNGSGSLSGLIAGIEYVTANAGEIDVANMSLGWTGNSLAARTAIQNAVNAGVVFYVAAGNETDDVYGADGTPGTSDDHEPASYPEVGAVSALSDTDGQPGGLGPASSWAGFDGNGDGLDDGADDTLAWFSNFSASVISGNPVTSPGGAIDLMLPGVDIFSTWLNGGFNTISGTSMAAPHAAGLAALYIAENGSATNAAGVYAIRQALIDAGVSQTGDHGLATPNDPDSNLEPLGWALFGPAAPVASVSASPSGQSDQVSYGSDATYTFTVTNTGDTDDTYTISTSSGWSSSVAPGELILAPSASADVTVTHTVAGGAGPGTSDAGTLNVSSAGTGASAIASFTTTAQGDAVDITPANRNGAGAPGSTLDYTYTVTNTGTATDSYTVSTSGSPWVSSVSPPSVNNLAPGASTNVTVSLTVPTDAPQGAIDSGILMVSGSASASAAFTTTALGYGAGISPGSRSGAGNPGATVQYSYTITNTGTAMDSYTVSISSSPWVSSVSPSSVNNLAPGASANVTVRHTIPSGASNGTSNIGTLTVQSNNSPPTSASASFTTTAEAAPSPSGMHVGDLDGTFTVSRRAWRATVTVEVHDENHSPVSGAVVALSWNGSTSGSGSCTTGSNGRCSRNSRRVRGSSGSIIFTVTGVTLSGSAYDPGSNHDPDGDSNGSTITVTNP